MRSSIERSSPVTGSVWCSAMWASINRRSNTFPLFREATGAWGASPEIAQSIFVVARAIECCLVLAGACREFSSSACARHLDGLSSKTDHVCTHGPVRQGTRCPSRHYTSISLVEANEYSAI
jgi:hypothetical protein